ncbi:MAG: hypothetical protein IMZ55_05630, partial [Acidobacteria bacterium]|nr:hypothetical protein [Acidobacteriota bacterium]
QGDGTVAISLASGHYLAYTKSTVLTVTAASSPVYFVVTDADEAVHYQILTAVKARVLAATLAGIANASVLVKKLPLERLFLGESAPALPGVIISPQRPAMPPAAGVTSKDDVIYGVLITLIAADNQEITVAANMDAYLLWLEQVAQAFRHQRLTGVSEVFDCSVEPYDPVLPQAWAQNKWASAVLLKFTAREPRGI